MNWIRGADQLVFMFTKWKTSSWNIFHMDFKMQNASKTCILIFIMMKIATKAFFCKDEKYYQNAFLLFIHIKNSSIFWFCQHEERFKMFLHLAKKKQRLKNVFSFCNDQKHFKNMFFNFVKMKNTSNRSFWFCKNGR